MVSYQGWRTITKQTRLDSCSYSQTGRPRVQLVEQRSLRKPHSRKRALSGGSYPFWVRWLPPTWGSFLKEGNISELLAFTAARGWVEAEVATGDLVLYSTQDLHL